MSLQWFRNHPAVVAAALAVGFGSWVAYDSATATNYVAPVPASASNSMRAALAIAS